MEAAFFDLDKTVIAKASMVAFGPPLYRAGMISRWLVARALWSQFVFQRMGADEERMRKFRESGPAHHPGVGPGPHQRHRP